VAPSSCRAPQPTNSAATPSRSSKPAATARPFCGSWRSEEHTSELQSRFDLVCRLLLEKKNSSSPKSHPTAEACRSYETSTYMKSTLRSPQKPRSHTTGSTSSAEPRQTEH